MHAFDRQTDRRMDGRTDRIPIAIPRLHSMQRGKNYTLHTIEVIFEHAHSPLTVLFLSYEDSLINIT